MAWFSILPSDWSVLETWLIRIFLLLGFLTIGPWALLIIYDLLLYIVRAATYEVPYVGGRARGRQRPHRPSFSERPSVLPRNTNMHGGVANGSTQEPEHLRQRYRERRTEEGSSFINES